MHKIFLIFVFAFLSSCNLFDQTNGGQNTGRIQIPVQNIPCQTFADCVLVNRDCCGCNAGGESIAIHISQEYTYNNEWQRICSTRGLQACKQWYRCEEFQVQCHNFRCAKIRQ